MLSVRPALSGAVVALTLGGCSGADGAPGVDAGDLGADVRLDSAGDAAALETATETATETETATDAANETAPDTTAETAIDAAPEAPRCPGEEPEPNDTEPAAVPLGAIDDCDSSGSTFSGYLSGPTDVDYWHYQGKDTVRCSVDPTASTKDDVELCVFVACLSGATQINGCTSGTPATSHAKLGGCCTSGPGQVVVDFKCTLIGSGDDADVYVRVRSPTAKVCQLYDVAYHY